MPTCQNLSKALIVKGIPWNSYLGQREHYLVTSLSAEQLVGSSLGNRSIGQSFPRRRSIDQI
jgi:hypothetical protein